MPDTPFASYAQNGEDVVLWRALGNIPRGRYVEVGANDPTHDSITKAFYDAGWHGVTVEPVHEYAEAHRTERPRDQQFELAVTDADVDSVALHEVVGTGLSTIVDDVAVRQAELEYERREVRVPARRLDDVLTEAGWQDADIQFLTVDVEGAEEAVLRSIDLRTWRPWVLVIEATEPRSTTPSHERWEQQVLDADYRFCLFDGLSRFYVAAEHAEALGPALSYPTCVLDVFTTQAERVLHAQVVAQEQRVAEVVAERESLRHELIRWRDTALRHWNTLVTPAETGRAQVLAAELTAMRETMSWRVTKPLRAVRTRMPGSGS